MKHEEKILCHYEINQSTDAGDFISLLSEYLTSLKTKLKKRIILSVLELVQNKIIYNNKNAATIQVIETYSYYIVKIRQYMETTMVENLINQLKNTNNIETSDLKGVYQENLLKALPTTGNGHIFCRIKSENPIDFYINDCNIFIIKLKFNKL